MDRSWYNRAGVERVMGFCTPEQYRRFLAQCPVFERLLVDDGIMLRKYWFSVSDEEQERRFRSRLADPMRRWKLSPMDLESITRWADYSRAKDEMFVHTDTSVAPWWVVEAERQAARPAQHDRPSALQRALPGGAATGVQTAAPPAGVGLRPATARVVQDRSRSRRDADQVARADGPRIRHDRVMSE